MSDLALRMPPSRSNRTARAVGICIGLIAAVIVLAATGGRRPAPPVTGPMMSECDGQIRAISIQYVAGADFVIPIYRQFLSQLPADVRVYAVCPNGQAFDELCHGVDQSQSRLIPVLTHHEMTAWSRDRWVALLPASHGSPITLLTPRGEAAGEAWPARAGDERIAADLAAVLSPGVEQQKSSLYFDGGDFLADAQTVFVTPAVMRRNLQHTVSDRAELLSNLRRQLQKNVVLLDNAPDHHAGMFMMAAGNQTIVVGDPRLARPLMSSSMPELPGGADFSDQMQARFDSVADAAKDAGYRVIRIATVPSMDGKTYFTYLNGIIDQRDGTRTIYLPQYAGADAMNKSARSVWQSLGYQVKPVDVTTAYRYFGTLHCLVNVIEKS